MNTNLLRQYRVAVIALHPIQYQAGLWRAMSRHPRLDIEVIYLDRIGLDGSIDPTMNAPMKWDVPLLDGYKYSFVPNLSPMRFTPVIHRINPQLLKRIRQGNFDVLIVHGYLTISNWISLFIARKDGLKLVYRGEGSMRRKVGDRSSWIVDTIKLRLNRFYLRCCDAIAYSTIDNREYQLSRGASEKHLFPMPCAVDNETLGLLSNRANLPRFRARYGLDDDMRIIITVGRFTENKRTQDCISALDEPDLLEVSNLHLIIAGNGPLRTQLERQVVDLGLVGRVHFLGFLGQQEIVEAILISEVFVLASSHNDPSPKALSEALFLRCPVVCTEGVGNSRELVIDGENGFVVPTHDPKRMATNIASVLSDESRRKEMGQRSHEIACRNNFESGVDSLVERLAQLIDEQQ